MTERVSFFVLDIGPKIMRTSFYAVLLSISLAGTAAAGDRPQPQQPLDLSVWVSDDRPARGVRGAGPVSWTKFRGPGDVTFANTRATEDAQGKASTTATFSAPGEYVLRGQANDSTGEGGGGFQCCWTNVHVKVTVTPNGRD